MDKKHGHLSLKDCLERKKERKSSINGTMCKLLPFCNEESMSKSLAVNKLMIIEYAIFFPETILD